MNLDDLAGELAAGRIDDENLAHLARLAEAGLSVATVVHEARQPLSALRIALQLARERHAMGDPIDEFLEDALAQSRRLEEFLERIRDHLQPGDGVCEIRIDTLVERVLRLLDWQLRRGRVDADVRVAPGLPPIVADRAHVEQILQNLLLNARDSLVERRGGGTITIEARRGVGDEVVLLIGDDGPGVPRHIEERVFDPFFTTKPRDRGTGLGLFISRRIARRAGGELELVTGAELNDVLGGNCKAVFRLRFPPRALTQVGLKALVVDDEEPIRRLVSKILEGEGFACATAADGEQAIELLDAGGFRLLVTDKNLPGASGIEVARFARALDPEMPVLLITGYASEESAGDAVTLGVSDYVIKPIDLDDFRARVRRAIGLPSIPPPAAARRRISSLPPAAVRSRISSLPPATAGEGAGRESQGPPVSPAAEVAMAVSVLVVEAIAEERGAITEALTDLGCTVAAFEDAARAEAHAVSAGFEVLVAGPAVLSEAGSRLMERAGDRALGSIALMDRGGVDRSIEAIHLGARGMLSPPFTAQRVAFEFKRSVGRLLEERESPAEAISPKPRQPPVRGRGGRG